MLGVVFTELLEMVEDKFGPDMVDDLLDDAALAGAYTAVGNYPFAELLALVGALEKRSGIAAPVLIEIYGEHLFSRFWDRYPQFFENQEGVLDFLQGIESRIHFEVRKLYPDAELPAFSCIRRTADLLEMHYQSPKCLGHLAVGLIRGCAAHFATPVEITASQDLGSQSNIFTVHRL
jgi:hypothetical protein